MSPERSSQLKVAGRDIVQQSMVHPVTLDPSSDSTYTLRNKTIAFVQRVFQLT
jgi:hypothetical protein